MTLGLVVFGCHGKEAAKAPDDEGCVGAGCLEEAEAALWEGDASKAREPLQALCEDEDAFSCFRLAELYQKGEGGPKDLDMAATYFERSCRFLYEEGCERRFELAMEEGDDEAAAEYAHLACEGGRMKGCMTGGDLAMKADDKEKAATFYEDACKQGDAEGCTRAGDLLYDPNGSQFNKARALANYNSACVGYEGRGCLQLALCFYEGIGTPKDVEKARVQFKHACELGVDDGCVNEKILTAAKGGDAVLQLTSKSDVVKSRGLEARDVSCQMDKSGQAGLEAALGAVARHRRKLNECIKKGGAPVGIKWRFEKGEIKTVSGNGKGDKRYAGCVAKELRKGGASGKGSCSAILLLGDVREAAAALPPKEPEPKPEDAAPEEPKGDGAVDPGKISGRSGKSGLVKSK
ncbi:MAG: sel1 repeat family protein [Myxococcales bacterium]|nr:sel1 repeat family protein [Myxococcales bacterium]